MKKVIYLIALSLMTIVASCEKLPEINPQGEDGNENVNPDDKPNKPDEVQLMDVTIQLQLTEAQAGITLENIPVSFTTGGTEFNDTTDAAGKASFSVPAGIYTAAASAQRVLDGGTILSLNASKEGITVNKDWKPEVAVILDMVASKSSQVVIKEIYVGGTTNPETSKTEAWDKYITLYNNSSVPATLKNLVLGNTQANAYAQMMGYLDEAGNLTYANEDWLPATQGCYYFPQDLVIAPYTDVVIALCGAIDHTQTNAASVDLSHVDYVCYDPESGYNHAKYHPAPSQNIPTDHYLKGQRWSPTGNSWMFSMFTPAFFIFQLDGKTATEYFADETLNVYPPQFPNNDVFISKKVKREWILDAVDTYSLDYIGENYKRMTPDLDAGFVYHTANMGYSLYRNVDRKATEAIAENAGKIVYGYALGTQEIEYGSTDMCQIDAEASIRKGAKIVYMDTNNSTNDFHLRKQCAQKTK